MKTFIVDGSEWTRTIEIDDSLYEKYGDMAMEAMTIATEDIINNEDDIQWGLIVMAYEKGHKDNPDKTMACLTEIVFRNAGYHTLADEAKRVALNLLRKGTN